MVIKEDVGGIEELTLQVSYLIPFKSYCKGFPVIKYTYVPCLKAAMLCVFAFSSLTVFMVHCAITYSEPYQTSKMELFVKIVTFKEVASLYRRLKGFWIRLYCMWSKLLRQILVCIAVYFRFEIICIFCHYGTIRFPFETLSILGFLRL